MAGTASRDKVPSRERTLRPQYHGPMAGGLPRQSAGSEPFTGPYRV